LAPQSQTFMLGRDTDESDTDEKIDADVKRI
jgi:hypothetical protein